MSIEIIPHLFYTWTGWPTDGTTLPPEPDPEWWDQLHLAYKPDAIHLVAREWRADAVLLTFSVDPSVSPVLFTTRVKGRLQHGLRQGGTPVAFSRKVSMRSVGRNDAEGIQNYLRDQLKHEDLVDARYEARLADASFDDAGMDLSVPTETNSGRYWYNLHVVTTTIGRFRVGDPGLLSGMAGALRVWAKVHGHGLRSLAVMPDHLHLAIRGNLSKSPSAIAETLWDALYRHMQGITYSDRIYAGTFSEYSLNAVKGIVRPDR